MNDHQATIKMLKEFVQQFIDERDWRQFHDSKNLAMSIAIEAAELMEHFQWLRSDQLDTKVRDQSDKESIEEEVADIFCYLLSFASATDIDLASALERKMAKNRLKYPADEYRGRF